MISPESNILIVGAGVFGLSTSLWLARSGYKNVTVYDRLPFDRSFYDPSRGCDGASADINKVFRMSYADRVDYQDLAVEARGVWLEWNEAIRQSSGAELPAGLTPNDRLLIECGCYMLGNGHELSAFSTQSLENMEKSAPGMRKMQFLKNDPRDEARLKAIDPNWLKQYHAVDSISNNNTNGVLDIQGGITIADKACVFTRHLCEQAGVKFVLGDPEGRVDSLIVERRGPEKKITGIETADGKSHHGDLVIVAAGGWSATLVPELHQSVETTAGTVLFIDVPEQRKDLWEKFHPDNYPVWFYASDEFPGEPFEGYSFPITETGRLKFGFRGTKFTNFVDHPSDPTLRVSTPRTKHTNDPIYTVPLAGMRRLKEVLGKAFPELKELGFTDSRLCWYTDTIDNHYLIDYVPEFNDTLFVCTGGSGHGFKFLPLLGRHVKNQLERKPDQFTPVWKWRVAEDGSPNNGISEGEAGPRVLAKQLLAKRSDFRFEQPFAARL